MAQSTWQDIARRVQRYRDSTINKVISDIPDDLAPPLPQDVSFMPKLFLSLTEVEITTSSPESLIQDLAAGTLTSTEVTTAFLRRAGLAQKLTNCITELLPERALHRAKELDTFWQKYKKPIGPLHGLPISVKEIVGMKGLDLNAAFVAWVGNVAEDDAAILEILWGAGCVFYARTTEPQLLMHLETSSNLYGETVNPFNRSLSSGGSSGGEGALMGLRGSCLGVGSDIGGSIRTPAAHNGVYGLRPTANRLPSTGVAAERLGSGYIDATMGPLSTSLEGINVFMKTILDAKPWLHDTTLIPLPWRDQESYLSGANGKKLRVGVLWNDGLVQPHPPVTRALKEVVEKLKNVEGVEIYDWKPYKPDLAWEIISSLYFMDAGKECNTLLEQSGEPLRPLSRFILSDNPNVKQRTVAELEDLKIARDEYRAEYAELWDSVTFDGLPNSNAEGRADVLLCPAFPGVAPPLNTSRYWSYTSQWNLLDYPAIVFPVTAVSAELDGRDENYIPRNEKDRENWELFEGPQGLEGVPVSLQLVARRFEDEKLVEALGFIKEKIGL